MKKNKLTLKFHFRSSENGRSAEELIKELVDETVKKAIAKYERSVYN